MSRTTAHEAPQSLADPAPSVAMPVPARGLDARNLPRLQAQVGNRAVARLLQRFITDEQIRAEAEARWRRKGKIDQTVDEQRADWESGRTSAERIETEARAIFGARGVAGQSALDAERDWEQARRTVRQRELAEDVWRARGGPNVPHDAALAAQDWTTAGDQLALEELWRQADPATRIPGELPAAVPARVAAAENALRTHPGYQAPIVTALLSHDHGASPRPFVTHTFEDTNGIGGHIGARHVAPVGAIEADERRRQAGRVCRHKINGGNAPCPGKAGSFKSPTLADAAIKRALGVAFRAGGGWAAPGGLRDKLARGVTVQESYAVAVDGYCQRKHDPGTNKYPVTELPAYEPTPPGAGVPMGGRPYFPSDPEFAVRMAAFQQPGPTYVKNGNPINYQPAVPLTDDVAPTVVELRVIPSDRPNLHGWFVHSAWPA